MLSCFISRACRHINCFSQLSCTCGLSRQTFGLGLSRGNNGRSLFSCLGQNRICIDGADLNLFTNLTRGFHRSRRGLFSHDRGPGQQFGPAQDLGDGTLPLDGHDMNTGDALDFLDLVDNINADIDSLFLLVFCSLHALDDLIGHIHARDKFLHITCHPQRFGGSDTGQNIDLLVKTKVTDHCHEAGKLFYIVDNLGLNKIGPGRHLLAQTHGPVLKGIGKRVGGSPEEKPGLGLLDGLTALKDLLVTHPADHTQHLDGIHVKNAFGAGMVAELLMVTGEAKQIFQAQGRGAQDI